MNILHLVSNSCLNGTSRHVEILCRGLRRLGHDVTVVCPPGAWLPRQLRDAELAVLEMEMSGASLLRTLPRIAHCVKSRNINVIHTHATRAAYIGLVTGALTQRPVVASVHIVSHDVVYRRLLARGANRIVAVSDFAQDVLLRCGAPRSHLQTIYPGTDFQRETEYNGNRLASFPGGPEAAAPDTAVSVRAELCLAPDAQLVGMFGYHCALKGQDILMEAARTVVACCARAHFVFVGKIGVREKRGLMETAARNGIAERIRLPGEREDAARLMAGMDVVAVPSEMESFGMVNIEAMALGRPVVASRVGGIPEVVVDGETGFLVERDPDSFAQAILVLLRDPERAATMGKAGQARVNMYFTAARMTGEYACLYDRVAALPCQLSVAP